VHRCCVRSDCAATTRGTRRKKARRRSVECFIDSTPSRSVSSARASVRSTCTHRFSVQLAQAATRSPSSALDRMRPRECVRRNEVRRGSRSGSRDTFAIRSDEAVAREALSSTLSRASGTRNAIERRSRAESSGTAARAELRTRLAMPQALSQRDRRCASLVTQYAWRYARSTSSRPSARSETYRVGT